MVKFAVRTGRGFLTAVHSLPTGHRSINPHFSPGEVRVEHGGNSRQDLTGKTIVCVLAVSTVQNP
jgi:hypothetical protein